MEERTEAERFPAGSTAPLPEPGVTRVGLGGGKAVVGLLGFWLIDPVRLRPLGWLGNEKAGMGPSYAAGYMGREVPIEQHIQEDITGLTSARYKQGNMKRRLFPKVLFPNYMISDDNCRLLLLFSTILCVLLSEIQRMKVLRPSCFFYSMSISRELREVYIHNSLPKSITN